MTAPPASLMALMDRHGRLDALFFSHQNALLDRDPAGAAGALEKYGAALEAHMSEEETHILPLYAVRAPQPPGGGVQMFLDEHRKLREFIRDLRPRVAALGTAPEPRAILNLLDRETLFKNYMDHHDRRERAFLYPGLDAVTTAEERRSLLATLAAG